MTGAGNTVGLFVWAVLAGIVILVAAYRVVRSPRELYCYGLLSKVAWLVTIFWLNWHWGRSILPLGGLGALWHLHCLVQRSNAAVPGDLPFAAGSPVDERGTK
jgi:hypothetical protein